MADEMRLLVVDDEPLAREGLRLHLDAYDDVRVVGEAGDGEEAVRRIEELSPDAVLLDVQMPGLDGFGVVDAVGAQRMPPVVFVTAYDEFALRAFEAHALDYVMKPVDPERLGRALERVRERVHERQAARGEERVLGLLESLRGEGRYMERVAVRAGERFVLLRADEIDYIEASGNYARIHAARKEYLLRETMTGLEARLDPREFIRIHRSTIVRTDRIRELEPLFQGDYLVILGDGTRLTSSRSYREGLQVLMGRGA
ncbi:MAG TPA: LytTR family DNA-binding domain-containing protein [Longimicrobiales bacterium]|nr:LytTR family DNA-binding domain-containing protein [Longimicrobiales bacterium]